MPYFSLVWGRLFACAWGANPYHLTHRSAVRFTQAEKQRRQQQEQAFQRERVAFEMQLEAANSCAQELDEKEVGGILFEGETQKGQVPDDKHILVK